MRQQKWSYALCAVAVFAVEATIALFVQDRVVRPLVGDALAVVLVYLAIRAATPLRQAAALALAVTLAFAIEIGQLLGVIDLLGLGELPVARLVLGARFDPVDLLFYLLGALGIVAAEALVRRRARVRPA